MMLTKLIDARMELEEAAARMPQDLPWQRVQNALVSLNSFIADVEAVMPAADPVAAEPLATEPLATEPLATEPLATEPLATEPVPADPDALPVL